MRKISEEDFLKLEQYSNCACNAYGGNLSSKDSIFSLIDFLEEKLKFDKYSKVEKNFGYVYYDVSNFDELSEFVKVLETTEKLSVEKDNLTLRYLKEYKILVKNIELLLVLKQALRAVKVGNFELPVYIVQDVRGYIWIDGIEDGIFYNFHDRVYSIETEPIDEVLKCISVYIKTSDYMDAILKVYNDGELVYNVRSNCTDKDIVDFLRVEYREGNITTEDFKFNKSRVVSETIDKKAILIDCYFKDVVSKKMLNMGYDNITCDTKKVTYEFTNNSKLKFVVIRDEYCLENEEITLYDFVENIRKSNNAIANSALYYMKCESFNDLYSNIILYFNSGVKVPKIKKDFVEKYIVFSAKEENGMFLPCNLVMKPGNFSIDVIYENIEVKEEFRENEITLTQYFYIEELSKEGIQKYILRMVYNFKKGELCFGTTKLENIILPVAVEDECLLIYLSDNFDISNVNLNGTKMVCRPGLTSCVIKQILNTSYKNRDYEAVDLIEDLDLYDDKKEITFCKLNKLMLDICSVDEVYDGEFTKEEIEFLKSYYM